MKSRSFFSRGELHLLGMICLLFSFACTCKPKPGPRQPSSLALDPPAVRVDTPVVDSPEVEVAVELEENDWSWQNWPEPDSSKLGREMDLWATNYRIHLGDYLEGGIALFSTNGDSFEVRLPDRDWCEGALQGTIIARDRSGNTALYNYADRKGPFQVDCRKYYRKLAQNLIDAMGKSRFQRVDVPYGLGVRNWWLSPLRTIAVDPNRIPYGSVVYIPKARGLEFEGPDGRLYRHDGFFFAGDTGGNIKENHIDIFEGFIQENIWPGLIRSVPSGTFKAFLVEDAEISAYLARLHHARI